MKPRPISCKCFVSKDRIFFSIFLLLFIIYPSFGQQLKDKFLLQGTIEGIEEGTLYLAYYVNKDDKVVNDSLLIHNGSFSFSSNISEPTVAFINLGSRNVLDANATNIFLEPAVMHLRLQLNKFDQAHMTGSNAQKEYENLEASKQSLHSKYKKEVDAFTEEKDAGKRDALQEKLTPYYAALHQKEYSFFDTHPYSYVTLYKLQYHANILSLDSLKLFYDRLPTRLQQNIIGKQIADRIKEISGGTVGSIGKNFISIDSKGDTLRLSDFKGKYVLLDFWASWCIPCRRGNPNLISLYSKYKNKGLEIIGISDDDNRPDAWRKAIEKDSIYVWKHILRGLDTAAINKRKSNNNDINKLYGVSVLPTKILINPSGLIVGRYEGESEKLDKKLAKIFK